MDSDRYGVTTAFEGGVMWWWLNGLRVGANLALESKDLSLSHYSTHFSASSSTRKTWIGVFDSDVISNMRDRQAFYDAMISEYRHVLGFDPVVT